MADNEPLPIIDVYQEGGRWTSVDSEVATSDRKRALYDERARARAQKAEELFSGIGANYLSHLDNARVQWERLSDEEKKETPFDRDYLEKYIDRNKRWAKNRGGGSKQIATNNLDKLRTALDPIEIEYETRLNALKNPQVSNVEAMGGEATKVIDAKLRFTDTERNRKRALVEVCGPIETMRGKVILELFSGDEEESLKNIIEEAGGEYHSVDLNSDNGGTRHTKGDAYKEVKRYQKGAFDHVIMKSPLFWAKKENTEGIPTIYKPEKVVELLVDCMVLLKNEKDCSVIVGADGNSFSEADLDSLNPHLEKMMSDKGLDIKDWDFNQIRYVQDGSGIKISRK